MKDINEYLSKTESAVKHLFIGIDGYKNLFIDQPVFSRSHSGIDDFYNQHHEYVKDHQDEFHAAELRLEKFFSEEWSMSVLCGAVLQMADKAIEIFSNDRESNLDNLAQELKRVVGKNHKKYCIGRIISEIPLGLIILAGRNQHMHYDDDNLHDPGKTVFEILANSGEFPKIERNRSLSSSVIALLGWNKYSDYESALRTLLHDGFQQDPS